MSPFHVEISNNQLLTLYLLGWYVRLFQHYEITIYWQVLHIICISYVCQIVMSRIGYWVV